jgi:hypothetical protein
VPGAATGLVTVSTGTLSISSRTIVVSGLTLAVGAHLTVIYGDYTPSGGGASSPTSGIAQSWVTKERSSAAGTLTALSASPSVDVLARDGSGTMSVSPTTLRSNTSGNTLTFAYTAAAGGIVNGTLTLAVPSGWSAPSTTGTAPGYVKASTGTVSISSRTIVVSSLTCPGGQDFTITYGSKDSDQPLRVARDHCLVT